MKRHNLGTVLYNNKYAMQCPEIESPFLTFSAPPTLSP